MKCNFMGCRNKVYLQKYKTASFPFHDILLSPIKLLSPHCMFWNFRKELYFWFNWIFILHVLSLMNKKTYLFNIGIDAIKMGEDEQNWSMRPRFYLIMLSRDFIRIRTMRHINIILSITLVLNELLFLTKVS